LHVLAAWRRRLSVRPIIAECERRGWQLVHTSMLSSRARF
jgi:hypothetical protein